MNAGLKILLLSLGMMFGTLESYSQTVAVKSNLLDAAIRDVNAGVEVGIAPKWTLDVPVSLNGWELSHGRRWKHWYVQPGVRYWFCDRFAGHFVGGHLHGGQFNIGGFDGKINLLGTDFRKLKDTRFQGWFIGGGVSYGYAWLLDRHWNVEGEIGVGYSYTYYDQYRCVGCGKKIKSGKSHNYVGPTKAAINVVYLF
ncbi:MAG: DUF3575 domain-containing protein [Prevotellaceae bacterium]|nr:DUF3575 domain-containing protein [Prevotellaceae bacterium]MDO4931816.1 DUF3575 domain-containing protein [Prevotellaceae bacterium]